MKVRSGNLEGFSPSNTRGTAPAVVLSGPPAPCDGRWVTAACFCRPGPLPWLPSGALDGGEGRAENLPLHLPACGICISEQIPYFE